MRTPEGELLTSRDQIVSDIIGALGFHGKQVTSLSIHFEFASLVTLKVECEVSVKQGEALKTALAPIAKTYHLVEAVEAVEAEKGKMPDLV